MSDINDPRRQLTPSGTDSGAAMAAEICRYFGVEARQDIQAIIDRHFAPLREELARLTVESERQLGHHIDTMAELVGCQVERMHLRASNDKLRAALEDMRSGWRYIRCTHGDLPGVGWDRCEASATAALAPERKEQP